MQNETHIRHMYVLYSCIAVIIIALIFGYFFIRDESARITQIQQPELNQTTNGINYASLPLRTPADAVDFLPFTIDHDASGNEIKVFKLTVDEVRWEYAKGRTMLAYAYNGQIPAPTIRATEDEKIRVMVTNNLPVNTSIHWHSVHVPFREDGAPGISQGSIQPGETYTYEFEAKEAGTRFFHSHGAMHGNEEEQISKGLVGAFIIDPKPNDKDATATDAKKYDKEYIIMVNDFDALTLNEPGDNNKILPENKIRHSTIYTINGRIFPDIPPIKVTEGDKVLLRYINTGPNMIHPMHIHGHAMDVIATDGETLDSPYEKYTLSIAPGEAYDAVIEANNPGIWLFHCHILSHASQMATLIEYAGYETKLKEILNEMTSSMHSMEGMSH